MSAGGEDGVGPAQVATWRDLRVGDRIRIVRMPSGFDRPDYFVHPDTRRLYARLIERGYSQRVARVDGDGLPWIECRFRLPDERWEYHSLAVNDDSWVLVRPKE